MYKYPLVIYGLILIAAFTACQRVIDVQIKSDVPMLVIEGNITNIAGTQTILLSKSIAYADANVYPPVSGAIVSAGSNLATYVFKETQPGQYTIGNLRARTGQSFTLNIQSANKIYTATSVLPQQVNLDSIGVSKIMIGNNTQLTVSVFYRDPPDVANQYRFVLFVNGVQVKQIFNNNDVLSNGRIINTMLYQDDVTIHSGDKIDVEMQCVDANVYNYWYSLGQQGGNGPNNSATPSNPISNISNGALGYFSVHTVQRKSLVIP